MTLNYTIEGTDLMKVFSGWVSFSVPANIETIKESCFYDCRKTIETIAFEGTNIKTFESYAFKDCTQLKNLDLRSCPSLNNVSGYVFQNTGLKELYFPPNCPVSWAGYQQSSIASFVTAENHAKYIAIDDVVYTKGMTGLVAYPPKKQGATLTIPSGVTSIYGAAFITAYYLRHIRFPKSLTTIGSWAFASSKIISAYLPDTITVVQVAAFRKCRNLQIVEIHANLSNIKENTFSLCTSLKDIFICGEPKIDANSFTSCSSLCTIHAAESTKNEIIKQSNCKPKNEYVTCKTKRKTYYISLFLMCLINLRY